MQVEIGTDVRVFFILFAIFASFAHTQEAHREVKHPELPKLVRNWAEKLGGELWHFGELVTRKSLVAESFKHTSIVQEDGNALVNEITERIKKMMDTKVAAVERIMEIAENVAATAADTVEDSFVYYKAKDLINSAEVNKETDDKNEVEEEIQEIRNKIYVEDGAKFSRLIQEDSEDYQLDQEENIAVEEEEEEEEEVEVEVEESGIKKDEEDVEQQPMASSKPPEDKTRLPLVPNPHFFNIPVNMNHSVVHVPSNVFDRSPEVIKGIKWSEELDKIFRHNYLQDETLSFQYFGSSTGFMRQYPALIWHQEPIDLFDCRTRSWYREAASSPKDVVILIDRSGSMTGMPREIAKHVVNNILDTLGNNDYVNIYTYSNTTEPLIECFDDLLVQANLANVRMYKEAMNSFKTEQIANVSLALTTAFKLLEDYRKNRPLEGAQCNQAIMLITDGVHYNYKEIFKDYNWQNLPLMPVRVFTYLIGREASDVREVKWMACANQGYYVHVSTYAEVREEVLHYLTVMARPLVLAGRKPNPTWSPIYADVTDPKLTNWLWDLRERNKQRDRFLQFKRFKNRTQFFVDDTIDKKYVYQQKKKHDEFGERQIYRMMTSVSLPVYDKRPNANISEKVQINEKLWITVTRETRIANLLGVAGTDVPIEYIEQKMLPYRVGVNGYVFIVTNNGYIMIHPDLRPVTQGILKPAYNRVDLMEIELLDDSSEPREFSDDLKLFRRMVIDQTGKEAEVEKDKNAAGGTGNKVGYQSFRVKTHIDDMKRVLFSKRHYYYKGIEETPFTVVLALPDRYGFNRIQHAIEDDPHRMRSNNKNLTQFFTGNWTIHPEWHYCKYLDDKHSFDSPEEELLHFLHKMDNGPWKWTPECDRQLIWKVVADAKITEWFNKNISAKEENGNELIKRFGIAVAFLATHSGLTRWQDFPQNTENRNKPNFHRIHNRAIDEVWYRRAVEQHYVQPRSFVYSVPFDAEYEDNADDILVTASHAIFKEDKGKNKTPVAVVGFQIYQSTLHSLFQKITNTCPESNCKRTCSSGELYCLVLDDSGYVIVSYDRNKTGIFLGDFRPDIMELLVEERIYNRTIVYDYQATCSHDKPTGSPASIFRNPLQNLMEILTWVISTMVYYVEATFNGSIEAPFIGEEEEGDEESDVPPSRAFEKDFDQRLLINKTQPEPCDTYMYLYYLVHYTERNVSMSGYNKTMTGNCSRPFLIQPVVGTNMVLLVINMLCPDVNVQTLKPNPSEVLYNMSRQCYIVHNNNFYRKNYMSCYNRSTHESDIKMCGGTNPLFANFTHLHYLLTFLASIIVFF